MVSADPSYNAKPAIQRTLTALGAKVVQRLGKDVTHVVYERRGGSGGGGGRNREAERELLELYAKVDRLDPRPTIVSPTSVVLGTQGLALSHTGRLCLLVQQVSRKLLLQPASRRWSVRPSACAWMQLGGGVAHSPAAAG